MKQSLKFTQPVLIHSFKDKFKLSQKKPTMPDRAFIGTDPGMLLLPERQAQYQSVVGKLLCMMQWLCPDIYISICEGAKHITCANEGHYQAMLLVMDYCNVAPK